MGKMFDKWIHTSKILIEELPNSTSCNCPNCGSSSVQYQYVGDSINHIGYLDIWCSDCLNGIHFSRVKIPDRVNILPFNNSGQIGERIPNFSHVSLSE